jgi:uncharacterized membrane protein YbhN (UPF0104 family)
MIPQASEKTGNALSLLKRIAPWVVAAGILAYLFMRIDRSLFLDSLKRAELVLYVPLVIIFVVVWFFIESFNLKRLYDYFGHNTRYSDMIKIRGATFLLMIINYGLGAGGIALYMKKWYGVSLLRSTGMIFYYMVVESAGIALLAALGFVLAGPASGIETWVFYLSGGLFVFYNCELAFLKYMPPLGFLKKFIQSRLLAPLREFTARSYRGIFIQRVIYFLTFVVFFWFAVRAFHMEVPFLVLTALVPIIFFLGNLPITRFGLGTIQAAMLYFFRDYSTVENILALSVLYSVSLLFFRALIGLYYLRKVTGWAPLDRQEESHSPVSPDRDKACSASLTMNS